MKTLIVLMAMFFSITALASREVGNGGDAIVCRNPDGSIKSAEQADYYEASKMRGIKIELGGTNLPWEEKVEIALKRLERLDPERARSYMLWAQTFISESRFVSGTELPDVSDTGGIPVPYGCKIEQVAIHKEPRFPEDKRYIINKDIWEVYDQTSKAGIVLHEIIYREALQFNVPNSIGVRYLNSVVSSVDFENYDLGEYIKRLLSSDIYSITYVSKIGNEIRKTLIPLAERVYNEYPPSLEWKKNVLFNENSIYIFKRQAYNDVPGNTPMPTRNWPEELETIFNTTLSSKWFTQKYYSVDGIILPRNLNKMGDGEISFYHTNSERNHTWIEIPEKKLFYRFRGAFIHFNSDGKIVSELPFKCGEQFINDLELIRTTLHSNSDSNAPISVDLTHGGEETFSCVDKDGSLNIQADEKTDGVELVRTGNNPSSLSRNSTFLTIVVKKLEWKIFNKHYIFKRKEQTSDNCKNVSRASHDHRVGCTAIKIDAKRRELLPFNPEEFMYDWTVQEL